jgi:hypothetical protein
LDIKHPPIPLILRTAKTVGTGLLAAVALLITGTEASAAPTGSPCSAGALACVDLSSQQAWLMRGGNVTYGPVPVATGKASAPTAPGIFHVSWKDLHHRSSEFHNAPMPYSVFFNGVNTDRAPTYPRVLDELLPSACHVTEQYANNAVEADHGRLKSRLRPMRGLKRLRSARVISTGHAFVHNLRRGHYELAIDLDPNHRIPAAFTDLALAI